MDNCEKYSINLLDYFIPPIIIFDDTNKLCISNDKTLLFISSSIRLFFYISIFSVYKNFIGKSDIFTFLLYYVLVLLIIINIVFLFLVYNKIPKYSKNIIY